MTLIALSAALLLAASLAAAPDAFAQAKKDPAAASTEELKALPGIGEAYSKKIIVKQAAANK